MGLPTLERDQLPVLSAPNTGPDTLIPALSRRQPILLSAAGDCINVLDRTCGLQQSLPFELAFPVYDHLKRERPGARHQPIHALAFDPTTNRIAGCSGGKVGVWEPAGPGYRVHSSFTLSHTATTMDYANGTLVAGGPESLSVWACDDSRALPSWERIALEGLTAPLLTARLSPSAGLLATASKGSTTVRISAIIPSTATATVTAPPSRLQFRSAASHSLKLRSVSWRPSDDPADSGPILFTCTLDGVFRIWGCMIDEPDFFSLWATLDVHSSLPRHIPLATCFRQTLPMWPTEEGKRGTKDEFVVVFSDGSVHLTTVTHFDCRPPTCLAQSTHRLDGIEFPTEQLVNLRWPVLLPAVTNKDGFHLVGRSSRGTLAHLAVEAVGRPKPRAHAPRVPVNSVGHVLELVPTLCGEALLAVGDNGHIQNWEVEDDLVIETFASDVGVEPEAKLATWHDGRMVAVVASSHVQVYEFHESGRLALVAELKQEVGMFTTLFVARTEEDSPSTTLVAVTDAHEVHTWTYSASQHRILPGSTQALSGEGDAQVALTAEVPVRERQERSESMALVAVDTEGTIMFWTADMPASRYEWTTSGQVVRTGRKKTSRAACSADWLTALVSSAEAGGRELSIWDSKSSEFTSGLQFAIQLEEDVVDLHWSLDGLTLALALPSRVLLLCAQRLDDLTGNPPWAAYASIQLDAASAPISSVCWLARGLAVAAGEELFFHSARLESGVECHALAEERSGPLPYTHPQLLLQALLHGHLNVVIRTLVGLAAQLTQEGDVTPIEGSHRGPRRVGVADFVGRSSTAAAIHVSSLALPPRDIFSALTAAADEGARKSTKEDEALTEDATHRLLAALKKCPMRGLSKIEHAHLAVVVQTVYEIQHQRGSLDENGLRYLISMRSFFIYNTRLKPAPATKPGLLLNARAPAAPASAGEGTELGQLARIKYRDVVWAFHSENQDLLLEESIKSSDSKLTWANAKALGMFLWLKSREALRQQAEAVGRAEYMANLDEKDPITASLFYLAVGKKLVVQTLWKQAMGHPDQQVMLRMLQNDFSLPRWKTAALKNAYALLSKRRFMFAATFFLLGDSLKDAVNVCIRQLDDLPLAIAIARVYEGDEGPVLRSVLEQSVLPLAFEQGFRWLASWAFWMLGRRDLAVQTIITPLADLATKLGGEYRLTSVGSPMHEDPCLILLFKQLRSWSLQTVKGAMAVPGRTEFNFVLHMSRVLSRMGCHAIALALVAGWEFPPPAPRPQRKSAQADQAKARPQLPASFASHAGGGIGRLQSLRRLSTKMDMPIPPSAVASRAPSPTVERHAFSFDAFEQPAADTKAPAEVQEGVEQPEEVESDEARRKREEDETVKNEFRAVLKTVKVATQAPAEFSFDSFNF